MLAAHRLDKPDAVFLFNAGLMFQPAPWAPTLWWILSNNVTIFSLEGCGAEPRCDAKTGALTWTSRAAAADNNHGLGEDVTRSGRLGHGLGEDVFVDMLGGRTTVRSRASPYFFMMMPPYTGDGLHSASMNVYKGLTAKGAQVVQQIHREGGGSDNNAGGATDKHLRSAVNQW
jgi:hypothetical protein